MIKIEKYGLYQESEYYVLKRFFNNEHLDLDLEEIQSYLEISLYDFDKDLDENLETGTKFLLLPVRKEGFGNIENRQFLSVGTKIISKFSELFNHEDREMIVVDYLTMFGLRLNRFINYNSDFFKCDERVFFEFLIMKYEYFGFTPFFLSYPTIYKEMGIRKDRAVSIVKKFKGLGFLESKIKTDFINGQPTQATFYKLNTERIIELIPQIYLDEYTSNDIKHDIEKYLRGNKSNGRNSEEPDDNLTIV